MDPAVHELTYMLLLYVNTKRTDGLGTNIKMGEAIKLIQKCVLLYTNII